MRQPQWLTPPQQRAWRAYLNGSAWLHEALNDDLEEEAGLSLHEYEILVRLSEAPGRRIRMSALADRIVHSRSRLTHTITRMQKRGWVNRQPSRDDGRGVEAVLTEEGWHTLKKAAPAHVASVRRHLVDALSPEQMEKLGEIFAAVANKLHPDALDVMAVAEEEVQDHTI